MGGAAENGAAEQERRLALTEERNFASTNHVQVPLSS